MQYCLPVNLNTNRKRIPLTVLLLLFPFFFFGQTLTGLWTGALHNDSNTVRKDQSFEIALTEYKGKVYGYSRSEFIVNDTLYYILKRVKGTIEGDICEVKDDEIISYNFRGKLDKGIKVTSTFRRNQNDSTWYLDGSWKTNATKKYYSVTGKVSLESEKDLTASKLFPHLEELRLANEVVFYKDRVESIPIVKVAKPEKLQGSYIPKTPKLTGHTAPIAIAAKPATIITPAIVAVPQSSIDDLPAIKKQVTDLAKTETKSIPSSVESVTPSSKTAVVLENKKVIPPASTDDMPITPVTTTTEQSLVKNTEQKKAEPAIATAKNNVSANGSSVQDKKTVYPETVATINPPVIKNKIPNQEVKNNTRTTTAPVTSTTVKTIPEIPAKETVKTIPAAPINMIVPEIKKTERVITEKETVIAGRKSEFSQVVNFKSDSLVISLYDNGEIDGDTVSVFINGEVLLSKQGLKSSAIKKTIYISPGQEEDFTLVMFAESLGKYPPNTGLLVIRDGDDVYNLRFSSDFQKNAGIVFRRKK